MMRCLLVCLTLILTGCAALAQSVISTVNGSVTITAGNTFQTALAAVAQGVNRRSLTIQNNNTNTDNCWLFIGVLANATKATSILLAPGGSYQRYWPNLPSDAINVTCTTTNDTVYLDTQ